MEPVTVPIERSKPRRSLTMVAFVFLGGIVGVGWIYGRKFVGGFKEKWEESEETNSDN